MPNTTRRQFADAFKSEAVRLTRESGRPLAQVAQKRGVSHNVLHCWRAEQQQVEFKACTRHAVRVEKWRTDIGSCWGSTWSRFGCQHWRRRRTGLDRYVPCDARASDSGGGGSKGYFAKPFLTALFRRLIRPHIAAKTTGQDNGLSTGATDELDGGYRLSQRVRKKIEELWGTKCWHGFRRFRRRGLL